MTISPTTVSSDLTQERSSKIDNLLAQLTEKNSSTTKKSQNTLTATVTKLEKFIETALGEFNKLANNLEQQQNMLISQQKTLDTIMKSITAINQQLASASSSRKQPCQTTTHASVHLIHQLTNHLLLHFTPRL